MRMQPKEAVYIKTNVKQPGFQAKPIQSELEVNYDKRFFNDNSNGSVTMSNPDAYTRLILDVLHGKQSAFVRDDELRRAWEIFTPVLHKIENENIPPIIYSQGSRGPQEADDFIANIGGYKRSEDYVYIESDRTAKKSAKTRNSIVADSDARFPFTDDDKCDIGLFGLAKPAWA